MAFEKSTIEEVEVFVAQQVGASGIRTLSHISQFIYISQDYSKPERILTFNE
jgi:hypothetical protein